MESQFSQVQFTMTNGKLSPSAHVAVQVVTDEGERQKWRCCLTLNDDGTWQWAPGPGADIQVPQDVTDAITAAVAARVSQHGVEREAAK